jgi:hypothetical protein
MYLHCLITMCEYILYEVFLQCCLSYIRLVSKLLMRCCFAQYYRPRLFLSLSLSPLSLSVSLSLYVVSLCLFSFSLLFLCALFVFIFRAVKHLFLSCTLLMSGGTQTSDQWRIQGVPRTPKFLNFVHAAYLSIPNYLPVADFYSKNSKYG